MKKNELIRKVNSIGKAIFVEYFSLFQSYAEGILSKAECIERLVSNKVSNDNGAAIRCSNAKLIFKAKSEYDALEIILDSKRLDAKIIGRAKKIIENHLTSR